MRVAAGGRNDFVVLRYSEVSTLLNKTCLGYVYVWFTLSDSPNTLYPECRKKSPAWCKRFYVEDYGRREKSG